MFGRNKISKQTSVSQIISSKPYAREIMSAHGIKFIGKDLSPLEPLEKVAKGNGLDEKEIEVMVREINDHKESSVFRLDIAEDAAAKLKEVLKMKQKKAVRLRLFSDGCALYTYDIDFTDVRRRDDVETNIRGVRIFVEKKSIDFLNGSKLRYDERQDGFIFDNPNTKK